MLVLLFLFVSFFLFRWISEHTENMNSIQMRRYDAKPLNPSNTHGGFRE
jgi:hypothetical protein